MASEAEQLSEFARLDARMHGCTFLPARGALTPRLLACGDLHIGAASYLDADERLTVQERVLDRIIDLGIEHNVDGLLFAGDAWERRRPTPAELLAFRRPIVRAPFPVIGIAGNHDVEAFEAPTGYDPLGLGEAKTIATVPGYLCEAGAVIARLPWTPPGRLVALEDGGDRDDVNERLAAGLVQVARSLYAQARDHHPSAPTILLAHWSVGGATTPAGVPAELFREPVLPLEDLAGIGYDAVILGHIHRQQILCEAPLVAYVGSPMPLNFGEANVAHACLLLDTDANSARVESIPLDDVAPRLVTVTLDARDEQLALEGAVAPAADVTDAYVRVIARGDAEQARRWDIRALRDTLVQLGARKVVQVDQQIERAAAAKVAGLDETVSDDEALARWLALQSVNGDRGRRLLDMHNMYAPEAAR